MRLLFKKNLIEMVLPSLLPFLLIPGGELWRDGLLKNLETGFHAFFKYPLSMVLIIGHDKDLAIRDQSAVEER